MRRMRKKGETEEYKELKKKLLSGSGEDKDLSRRRRELGRPEVENKDKDDDSFGIPLNNKVTEKLCWWFLFL